MFVLKRKNIVAAFNTARLLLSVVCLDSSDHHNHVSISSFTIYRFCQVACDTSFLVHL